ncbi:glycoside hydrolase family 73 protein [Companilactobacillus keshanensis]|uniref:Glycoside hydrolase family 73 protein n=1 Tax=Companilactobacillus keshanensis TaxID=2486003 RepID=A0ABW4BS64_9LACO|nr:glycoside hydrolase family 73 protein [Companilactobacillus keshanensis]
MLKKSLLTSAIVLGTLASAVAPTSVLAADASNSDTNTEQTSSDNSKKTTDTNVISGSPVKEADPDIAHIETVQPSAAKTKAQGALVQAASGTTSSQQQAFLDMAVPMAQKAASEYGVYASVMLAQAILESGWGASALATQGNNLFGIKGDYNGSSVTMKTSEWSASQGWYTIYASFRKYPSYYESFADNGDKLRNGVSWDSSYYKGTWKENASSYKDATAWLQGRYATAPTYASSLNNVIETYGLTKYDTNSGDDSSTQAPGDVNVISVKNPNAIYVPMVTFNGDTMGKATRGLQNNTPWQTDQVKTYNGHVYYRVSTNEWVEDTYVI